jgi:hypothetical protein
MNSNFRFTRAPFWSSIPTSTFQTATKFESASSRSGQHFFATLCKDASAFLRSYPRYAAYATL